MLQGPGGVDNLWELVSLMEGQTDSELSPEYRHGVMHYKHVTKFKAVSSRREVWWQRVLGNSANFADLFSRRSSSFYLCVRAKTSRSESFVVVNLFFVDGGRPTSISAGVRRQKLKAETAF